MTEEEVKKVVTKLIADNNFDAEIVEIECDDDLFDFWTVELEVARNDLERAKTLRRIETENPGEEGVSLRWEQKTPELVGAEVGDLVLCYCQHYSADIESDVGLVTAKFTADGADGAVQYGCRHIHTLGNRWIDHHYNFELTSEDYAGYQTGFLKVLTQEEAQKHLLAQLQLGVEKELADVKKKYENSVKSLPNLLAKLTRGKKVNWERMDTDSLMSFGLSVKK